MLEDQLDHVEQTSAARGDEYLNLALLTDGLRAEREQGITIDVAYRYFQTARRKFIIADTPGHVRYTRNMVTGASTADLSVVLVDARHGVVEQSKRHAFIASLLRVPHLVVCINKMDLVAYDEQAFHEIAGQFSDFAAKLEISDITFIPISALLGDNVVERSSNMPWYEGPPLLYHLETVHISSDRNLIDGRFPVQTVIRPISSDHHDYRGYAGEVAGGVLRPGDDVVVLPSGAHTRIEAIETADGPLEQAYPPMSVTLRLADDLDVSRGDMICREGNRPTVAGSLDAMLCWMSEQPLVKGRPYALKHATRGLRARVDDLRYRIDVDGLHRDTTAESLELNDIGRVALKLTSPLAFDPYARNRTTGSFILMDETSNDTVAAGMILPSGGPDQSTTTSTQSPNVVWQRGRLEREERWARLGHRGAVVWLTGLPASGKSTIAAEVEAQLVADGIPAYMLDGDNLRHGLNGDLGFDAASRSENIRRTAHAAQLLADAGTIALVSLVSPMAADRAAARRIVEDSGIDFIEVFVNTPLEECERRDPKGLYARARTGEIKDFTGVGAAYEAPVGAEVEILPGDRGADAIGLELKRVLSLG